MKKHFILTMAILIATPAWATYDFSYTYSGKTLYYSILSSTNHTVSVVYPNDSFLAPYYGFTEPTGSVSIPSNVTYQNVTYTVTKIDSWAFYECTGITSFNIPSSVTTYIQPSAFWGCSGVSSISIASGNSSYDSRNNCNAIIRTATNQLLIGCKNTIIPSTVTSIDGLAFDGCTGLTSITIPNSVTHIGASAFRNCTRLTYITIPNSVTYIGSNAFDGCTGLTSITIPNSVTTISGNPFTRCSGLNSIYVNSENTVYDSRNNCNAIIKTSDNSLLAGCKNTTIPNDVLSIEGEAFSGCTGLISITLPNSVHIIKNSAFSECTILRTVNMGSSIDSIKYNAFHLCSSLDTIICLSNNPPLLFGGYTTPTSFGNCGHTVSRLIVPCNRTGYYSLWSSYFTHTACVNVYSLTVQANNTSYGATIGSGNYLQGSYITISATANTGHYFSNWNDNVTTNPRTIQVNSDTTFTAIFIPYQYTIALSSNDTNLGIVTGGGTFDYGSYTTLIAMPKDHCHFVRWSDNSTSNPRNLIVVENNSITAYFAIDRHTISASSSNQNYGNVTGGGEYDYGTLISLSAIPANSHCHFVRWDDGNADNPRTVTVLSDTTYIALFTVDQFNVSVTSANPEKGFVTGDGVYDYNSTATVTAVPHNGYQFLHWSDGNTDATRSFTVTQDVELVAYFGEKQGIDIVEDSAFGTRMTIFPNPASNEVTIRLEGLQGSAKITITDLTGRKVLEKQVGTVEHTLSVSSWSPGTYFVKAIAGNGTTAIQKIIIK